jgi:uncharacterized membrane protein
MKFKDMPKLPLVLIGLMFVIGALAYPRLPELIPMHWGPSGQIDGWGTKSFLTVFFAPLMATVTYLLLWFVPYLDPQRGNLVRSKQVYSIALELLTGMMVVIFLGTLYASFNHSMPMASILGVCMGVMFVVLGNYMGRVKRNWTMGFRYSWTLSDDVVWTKTNRLGGRLFMAAGFLAIIGAFLPPLVGIWFVVVPALVMLPITYIYSMRLYKERHPGAMEPPRPLADPIDSPAEQPLSPQPGAGTSAVVAHDAVPPSQRLEVECPSCGADNAPGNETCIRCGHDL